MSRPCSKCGRMFDPPRQRGGRPRTRCDECRTHHDRLDGKRWRELRKVVLAGDPPCRVCGRVADQVDHIVPLAKGGDPFDLANLRPLCGPCNASKGSRPVGRPSSPQTPVQDADGRAGVIRVEERANSRIFHFANGSSHHETAMKW